MRRWLIAVAVLAVLAPAALWAQEEGLTLESVAESLAALVARISALETAVETPDLLTGIPIRDEQRCTPYNASSYSYPDGLELELLREMDGLYYSPYTDQLYADPREVDIEHIVARSEAHDSGLCAADRFTRLAFASDYLNLTFAPSWLNRDVKVAKDLAEWLPDANRCWYANRVVMVKRKYGLSMDADEAEVARRLLQSCESVGLILPDVTRTPTPTPTITPTPEPGTPTSSGGGEEDPLALYDDDGNGKISCAEARNHNIAPVHRGQPAYEHMRDADGDGVVCE